MIGEFLTATFKVYDEIENIWVDGFLFRHSSNSKTELAEIWQQTGVCICASKNADWNQQ